MNVPAAIIQNINSTRGCYQNLVQDIFHLFIFYFSLRMLNPQTFDEQVWKLCATLQEFFGSFVGTNMYLTPPGTQGFAPHYDDVEVFILQLEGKKHWRVYEPRTAQETLPRYSSCNFSQDEIGM